MPQHSQFAFLMLAVFVLLVLAFSFAFFFKYVPLWLRAESSGVRILLPQLMIMSMRKIPPERIVDALILARQSGLDLSSGELQRAYLQGVDVEKAVLAMIEAKRREQPVELQQIVNAELRNRLEDKFEEAG